MSKDVFISYSSGDKRVADAICKSLESKGLSCWISPRDIQPGQPYSEAILEALEASQVLVVIVPGVDQPANPNGAEIHGTFFRLASATPMESTFRCSA